jgi:hypothetical protein
MATSTRDRAVIERQRQRDAAGEQTPGTPRIEQARRRRRTTSERDEARAGETRTRGDLEAKYRAREEGRRARATEGKPARPQDQTTVVDALEAEREAGRREGAGGRAPAASSSSWVDRLPASSGGLPSVSAPLAVEVALITADEIIRHQRAPVPSRLLIALGFFGALSFARGRAAAPATTLAWGLVVATFYAGVGPTNQPAALSALAFVGDFVAGKYGNPGSLKAATPPSYTAKAGAPVTNQRAGRVVK